MPDLDLPRIGAIAHMGHGVSQLAHLGALVWQAPSPATIPAAFQDGDWSVETGEGEGAFNITITTMPPDGGSDIIRIMYSLNNGGSWTQFGSPAPGTYQITAPLAGTSYPIRVRQVNSIGPSVASPAKTAISGANDEIAWIYPEYMSGGRSLGGMSLGHPEIDANGDTQCVSVQQNGRIGFPVPAGATIQVETRIRYDNAPRLIMRAVPSQDHNTSSGNIQTVYDVTGSGTLTRADTITLAAGQTFIHLIGILTAGQYFTVLQNTRYRIIS